MIDKQALIQFLNDKLKGTPRFPVDVTVSADNVIDVEIDTESDPIDIDYCVELSRAIEEAFPRDEEDYELMVGTSSLTAPFKVRGQYVKNIGKEVEVYAKDNRKYTGTLTAVGDESFEITSEEKVRHEGEKRPVMEKVERKFLYTDVRKVQYLFRF